MATASKIVIVKQPYVQRKQILKLVNSVRTVNVTNTIANRITEKKKKTHCVCMEKKELRQQRVCKSESASYRETTTRANDERRGGKCFNKVFVLLLTENYEKE